MTSDTQEFDETNHDQSTSHNIFASDYYGEPGSPPDVGSTDNEVV